MSIIVDNIIAIDELVKLLERRKLLFLVSVLAIPQPIAISMRDSIQHRSEIGSESWIPYASVLSICIGTIAIAAFYSWFSVVKPCLVYDVAVRYFFVLLYFLVGTAFSFPFLPHQTITCAIPFLCWLSIHLFFIWRNRDTSICQN
jgi:hypothetical protein